MKVVPDTPISLKLVRPRAWETWRQGAFEDPPPEGKGWEPFAAWPERNGEAVMWKRPLEEFEQ